MSEKDLENLDNKELIELLQTLEGMNDSLKELEKKIKGENDNEKK